MIEEDYKTFGADFCKSSARVIGVRKMCGIIGRVREGEGIGQCKLNL